MSGYGGGGDWGSAGPYSAAGFDASGAVFGGPYDASVFGSGAGGGGDWGSFQATNYAGFNVSDPNQTQNITLSPYDVAMSQTGGGDWGSSGIYSAAGLNVDQGASNVSNAAYNAGIAGDLSSTGAYFGYSPYSNQYGGNLSLAEMVGSNQYGGGGTYQGGGGGSYYGGGGGGRSGGGPVGGGGRSGGGRTGGGLTVGGTPVTMGPGKGTRGETVDVDPSELTDPGLSPTQDQPAAPEGEAPPTEAAEPTTDEYGGGAQP